MSSKSSGDFPKDLAVKLGEMDKALKNLEKSLDPFLSTPLEESYQSMTPLQRAKYDLVSAYAMNSLFWIYLRTRGEDTQEHGIKTELERLKTTMLRVKEIEDKAKAMRVDRPAAHRMVSKSLWQAKERAPKGTPDEGKRSADASADPAVKRKKKT
ncbi:nuclear nucleic acid-binding protein C1D-like isoform X1 [Amphibalanus amphitrite]|uniref:nuclear nucleic acid-binding protein C1D-like isoform X1 n=2 Tax=Amphibalanus amphitrite TaxID=1232801 RepID=UPI001C90C85C|nr:nuclear nucleic acid-binding protein C1D-like isoform X1 [Amphibalanus amphitrite]XP_043221416.1 nuclear nucleic acid-binding protein C1D-like isoform X1 [Amphibalanus amphitrite]XP_043221419.1 nuclear nucleic acid-binding protein C1D-like isoform X1 [Amphibalanus amphitrite]XP_043221420.1 nuclear nucleic acid-binding protein C1D-like isoform X1 [Amphibalanus amphitrite]XP_043221423.1 nuclear nucleic acid-binding protein C1D-like isoform X1 [Amphibalanus amphitrite]XP_043221425.1 nuclear nu